MKSFIAYPLELEKLLYPQTNDKSFSGKLVAHYELYKKVRYLEGAVIKCGITANEGFTRFAMFRSLMSPAINQKMIAFEKFGNLNNYEEQLQDYNYSEPTLAIQNLQQALIQKGIKEQVEFVPGNVTDTIPEFLIENPELKISYLNIDLDNYESTLTALEFFYPRLVSGGILILDNYYKCLTEFKAVKEYFVPGRVSLHNYSVNKGPSYLIKD
ncbi:MAG: dTDP-6-deoxy-L-hexose 3-O-methyltransferase [Segetibacter sp.]|nr:dTDP-6-deoxy-L-hexose 3-O-methyltransferase [Segetibacter sp.]